MSLTGTYTTYLKVDIKVQGIMEKNKREWVGLPKQKELQHAQCVIIDF